MIAEFCFETGDEFVDRRIEIIAVAYVGSFDGISTSAELRACA